MFCSAAQTNSTDFLYRYMDLNLKCAFVHVRDKNTISVSETQFYLNPCMISNIHSLIEYCIWSEFCYFFTYMKPEWRPYPIDNGKIMSAVEASWSQGLPDPLSN